METNTYDVQRIFLRATQARDIAEPLRSFDAGTPAIEAHAVMQRHEIAVAGVRVNGLVAGFVTRASLADGACGDAMLALDQAVIVDDSAPLAEVVSALKHNECVFPALAGRSEWRDHPRRPARPALSHVAVRADHDD